MEISQTDIELLVEYLKRDHEIDFKDYAQSSFKRRIERILQLNNIDNVQSLILKLKKDSSYLKEFVEEITVNTTELFRDPPFWIFLRDEIIPKLKDFSTIRIWHAGCSTGEEVFSLAILLKEAGLYDRTKVVATDLNQTVIDKAKEGKYSAINNLPVMIKNYTEFNPEGNFNKYHAVKGKFAHLDKSLLDYVDFKQHNLVKDCSFAKVNLILCRNVLIYFNQELQNKVLNLFEESMLLESYLAIGSKETLMLNSDNKKYAIFSEKHRIYKKL